MNTQTDNREGQQDLVSYLLGHWKLLAIAGLACAILGGVYGFTAKRQYRADVVLAYVEDQQSMSGLAGLASQFGGLASLAGINLGDPGSAKHEALGVLQSRQLTADFINRHDLMLRIYAGKWDEKTKTWRPGLINKRPPTVSDAIRTFSRNIRKVTVDPKSGLVTLSITWGEPTEAATWANALVSEINNWLRARAVRESEGRIAYLRKEIANSGLIEVNEALNRLVEGEIKSMSIARTREEYAFRVVDPARIPEEHEYVSPRPLANIVMGFVAGSGLAMVYFMMRLRRRRNPAGKSHISE